MEGLEKNVEMDQDKHDLETNGVNTPEEPKDTSDDKEPESVQTGDEVDQSGQSHLDSPEERDTVRRRHP